MKRPHKFNDKYARGYSHSFSVDYEIYNEDLEIYIDWLEEKLESLTESAPKEEENLYEEFFDRVINGQEYPDGVAEDLGLK